MRNNFFKLELPEFFPSALDIFTTNVIYQNCLFGIDNNRGERLQHPQWCEPKNIFFLTLQTNIYAHTVEKWYQRELIIVVIITWPSEKPSQKNNSDITVIRVSDSFKWVIQDGGKRDEHGEDGSYFYPHSRRFDNSGTYLFWPKCSDTYQRTWRYAYFTWKTVFWLKF